jgi:hypothetical protein
MVDELAEAGFSEAEIERALKVHGATVTSLGRMASRVLAGSKGVDHSKAAAAIMLAMPRADRLSLNADGFNMPSVDHMSNRGSLNVLLDRTFSGLPAGLPSSRALASVFHDAF